jgi:hypothetical protein
MGGGGGPLQVDAQVEVGGEPVAQVLGRKVGQRCRGQEAPSDRGDVVSLVVYVLDELRKGRPVSLAGEALV